MRISFLMLQKAGANFLFFFDSQTSTGKNAGAEDQQLICY